MTDYRCDDTSHTHVTKKSWLRSTHKSGLKDAFMIGDRCKSAVFRYRGCVC